MGGERRDDPIGPDCKVGYGFSRIRNQQACHCCLWCLFHRAIVWEMRTWHMNLQEGKDGPLVQINLDKKLATAKIENLSGHGYWFCGLFSFLGVEEGHMLDRKVVRVLM